MKKKQQEEKIEALKKALEEILYLGEAETILVAKKIAGKALLNNTSDLKMKPAPDMNEYTKRFISAHQRKD